MNKRVLGRSGIDVSELAFGGAPIGMPYGIGVGSEKDMMPESEATELLRVALDRGINFYDAAREYGRCEVLIGRAFKGRRHELVLSTKCKGVLDAEKRLKSPAEIASTVRDSLHESLTELQTDYVDMYMVHDPGIHVIESEDIAKAFCQQKEQGKARAIGVSTYSVEESKRAIATGVWDVIQLAFNLMDQRQGEVFSLAKASDIGIVVRSVLLKGVLTDKGEDLHSKLEPVKRHREKYKHLLTEDILTLYELALRFALSKVEVSSVLLGIDRMEYLTKAIETVKAGALDEMTLARISELAYLEPEFLDLPEWDRQGWLR